MSFMSIHNTAPALNVSRSLVQNTKQMNKSMEKLASGFRINTAEDGPADLIQSEKLRSQIAGLEKAIQNVSTNRDVLSITEGALGQVQNILRDMRALTISASNKGVISGDQIAADQAQLDAGLQAIDRILGTTNYAGRKLLDNLNIGVANSGSGSGDSSSANIIATPESYLKDRMKEYLNSSGATEFKSGDDITGLLLAKQKRLDENGNLLNDTAFTIDSLTGEEGDYETLNFAAGTSVNDMVARLKGIDIPQEELDKLAEQAAAAAGGEPREGDVFSIFNKNEDGKDGVTFNTRALELLQGLDDEEAAKYLSDYMSTRAVTGNVEGLSLDGKQLSKKEQLLLEISNGLQNMSMGSLGQVQVSKGVDENGLPINQTLSLADLYGGGLASLGKDPDAARKVLDQAIKDVAAQRASIGATQKYQLDAMEENYRTQVENLTKMESHLRDTDYAEEMTKFVKSQVLTSVGTQMLSAVYDGQKSILDIIA